MQVAAWDHELDMITLREVDSLWEINPDSDEPYFEVDYVVLFEGVEGDELAEKTLWAYTTYEEELIGINDPEAVADYTTAPGGFVLTEEDIKNFSENGS